MGKRKSLQELKELYPKLWEKAQKKYSHPTAQAKWFRAQVLLKESRIWELQEEERERKRRTRALILFASSLIRKLHVNDLERLISLARPDLIAKERGKELDYLPFLEKEVQEVKTRKKGLGCQGNCVDNSSVGDSFSVRDSF